MLRLHIFHHHNDIDTCEHWQIIKVNTFEAPNTLWDVLNSYCHFEMEIIVRLFPYAKIIAGMRQVCNQSHLFMDSAAAKARRNAADTLPRSSVMIGPGAGCHGCLGGDPCSLFQTQAAQTVLQTREGPAMPRMAVLLGLTGIGMSGYSSRQLTLHCKPSSHLFRWHTEWMKSVHTYKCRLTLNQVSPKFLAT